MSHRVAACYVLEKSSPYRLIDDVDLWPPSRDARTYDGPLPGVYHPDCGPWSAKWSHACRKGPEVAEMALIAVRQVRTWGGIMEHPRGSLVWSRVRDGRYQLNVDARRNPLPLPVPWRLLRPGAFPGSQLHLAPPATLRDAFGGFTVEVELCWWTTEDEPIAWRKPTWLYCAGLDFDEVVAALPEPCEPAEPTPEMSAKLVKRPGDNWHRSPIDVVSPETRQRTPLAMARWLVDLAANAKVNGAVSQEAAS